MSSQNAPQFSRVIRSFREETSWELHTRETPREFGFRLALSGFSIETACTISTCLRLQLAPLSPAWPGSSALRFDPSLFGRCPPAQNPRVPVGRRPASRRCDVTDRDLGSPDGHWPPAPKGESPCRRTDRGRLSDDPSGPSLWRSPSGASAGLNGPPYGSLSRPKPFEWVGRYARPRGCVNPCA